MAGDEHTKQPDWPVEVDTFRLLDKAFAHQKHLDPTLLLSVRAWQGIDRRYELVQRMVREESTAILAGGEESRVRTMREHLDIAVASGRAPFAMLVYRGLRDLRRALRIEHPTEAVGRRFRLSGYTATTVSRSVAVGEFTQEGGGLLEIHVPEGMPALWVANVGSPELRRQGEMLLGDGIVLHVYSLGDDGPIPVLTGEVMIDD
jgi:hypothetical protein